MRIVFCQSPDTKRQTEWAPEAEIVHCHDFDDSSDEEAAGCFSKPPLEAVVRPLPRPVPKKPSDRQAHRQILERCFLAAHKLVAHEAKRPLFHGRCALAGLLALTTLRAMAWVEGISPGHVLFGIHWLTSTADVACIACAAPFFFQGTRGQCVFLGCIGPMVTLIFSMCLADCGALVAYMAIATPRPLRVGGRSWVAVLEACIGTWEFVLFASVALQLSLCTSSWRIYRLLRMAGLYPPGRRPKGLGKILDVSCLELVCEADDASRLSKQCEYADSCVALIPKGIPHEDIGLDAI